MPVAHLTESALRGEAESGERDEMTGTTVPPQLACLPSQTREEITGNVENTVSPSRRRS